MGLGVLLCGYLSRMGEKNAYGILEVKSLVNGFWSTDKVEGQH